VVRGEWWISESGEAEFADQDVGEAGHERIALQHFFGDHFDEFAEALEAKGKKIQETDDLLELWAFGELDDAMVDEIMGPELHKEIKDDVRMAYAKRKGAILAIDTNFAAYKITNKTIQAIQKFLEEQLGQFNESVDGDTEMMVEEYSTNKSKSISISDFLGLKYAAQLWKLQADIDAEWVNKVLASVCIASAFQEHRFPEARDLARRHRDRQFPRALGERKRN
jgi:hypothetical protein